jgi:hypothetical protein
MGADATTAITKALIVIAIMNITGMNNGFFCSGLLGGFS